MENNANRTDEIMENETLETDVSSPPPVWKKTEWVFLLSALLAAGCYFFAHFPYIFTEISHLPGIGLTLTQWLLVAVSLFAAKKKGRLCLKGHSDGVFLLAIALLLGASYGIWANDSMRLMNLPVVFLATAFSLFSLTDVHPLPILSGQGLWLALKRFVPVHFIHWLLPFRALKNCKIRKNRNFFQYLGAGLICGVPVVVIALFLLSSADAVFGSMIQNSFHLFDHIDFSFFVRVLYTLAGCLFLFSFLYSTVGAPFQPAETKQHHTNPITLITVLAMLGSVYALFVYVQFRYLFFGTEERIREIGYAEYARSGFFQLVALAFLTLFLILPFLALSKKNTAVRVLCALIALLTAVIDYSAFFRMRLYIHSFGLSVLRLITLWGMMMILFALIACVIKCVFPEIRICPALTVLALVSWLALNFGNVDRIVARYQVNGFNSGALSSLDTSYIAGLSPDVLPELERIADESVRKQAITKVHKEMSRRYPVPYDWSISWINIKESRSR